MRTGPIVDPARVHRATLPNGLELVVLVDRRVPQAGVGLTTRHGADLVPPAAAGLAAFTAELLGRGAGARDHLEFAEAVDRLGAAFAAAADFDSMTVSLSGLSRDLETLLELLADVVLRPRFDVAEAERARAETLAALRSLADDPGALAGFAFADLLYRGHPYGTPPEGCMDGVSALGAADARRFHARGFTGRDAILWAWGDVEPAPFEARARSLFGSLPAGEGAPAVPAPPDPTPRERRLVVVDLPDRNQVQIVVGHDGIARADPRRVAASLLNAALGGGGFLSRLMTRVRAEEGLSYGIQSSFSLRHRPGPFSVSTSTRVAETRRVLDLVLAELERARREPPRGREFRDAQTLLAGRFVLGLETAAAILGALVEVDVGGLPDDSLDTYRARVAATTPEDVARAGSLLHPERAGIVLVGPAREILPQLEGLGPVEVVAPEEVLRGPAG
jgi:zinc protease